VNRVLAERAVREKMLGLGATRGNTPGSSRASSAPTGEVVEADERGGDYAGVRSV